MGRCLRGAVSTLAFTHTSFICRVNDRTRGREREREGEKEMRDGVR